MGDFKVTPRDESLPMHFRSGGGIIFNFDWIDYAAGVGYKTYYGCASRTSGGTAYFLTDKEIDSTLSATGGATSSGAYAQLINQDFDLVFERPAQIGGGDALINCTWHLDTSDSSAYCVITIYHYDGTTETSLGTATTATQSVAGGGGAENHRECLKIAITDKKFNSGDTLRLTWELYGKSDNGTVDFNIWHDPSSRATVTEEKASLTCGTDLSFHVPFRVDL